MLQQTRVEAVIPYYNRWLEAFPDIDALAAADLHDVLKQWEGLGYYSRARNLHAAAGLVRERYNSALPDDFGRLRELPGIGEYTAGAIASIAYNQPQPAVDGNVRRVLSRLYDVAAPTPASVRNRATALLDPERPGDLNQALMELGATVCTPRAPRCVRCPVSDHCLALARGTIEKRPGTKPAKPIPHEHVNTLIRLHDGMVLLAQRPENGLLGGLWEFINAEIAEGAEHLGDVTHVFSHKRVTYHVFLDRGYIQPAERQRWVRLADVSTYPLPNAQRRILDILTALLNCAT